MKKFLSLLLSFVMLTSVAQLSAFADIIPTADNASSTQTTVNTEDESISDKTEETTVATESESVTESTTQPTNNTYNGAVEYADEDETSDDGLVEKSILGYYNGYSVKVSGRLPKVATLSLTSVDDESANQLVSEMEKDGKAVFACDIKVLDENGNEWQPEEHGLDVTITGIDLPEEQKLQFLHISEDIDSVLSKNNTSDSVETIDSVSYNEDKEATFTTYGFSTFVGFTVEFHYNGQTFTMAGETEVLLSTIFSQLQIQKDVAEVIDVTFSDTSLITVKQKDGDWLLTSLKAFSTNEALNVKFSNGETLKVLVTDYTTSSITIGNVNHSENTSGILGLKIDYTGGGDGLGTADTYKFSSKVSKGNHLTLNLGGTVRLHTDSAAIRVGTGAKLTININRKTDAGEYENVYLSPGDMDVARQLIYVEKGASLIINGLRTTSTGTKKYLFIDARNLKQNGGGGTDSDYSARNSTTHLIYFGGGDDEGATASDVAMYGVQIKNFNSASSRAMQVNNERHKFYLNDVHFSNIKSGTSGPALRFDATFESKGILIENSSFNNCTATSGNGAGISIAGGAKFATNLELTTTSDFTSPSGFGALDIVNTTFSSCKSSAGNGGAVSIEPNVKTNDIAYFKGCKFTNCTASGKGGALNLNTLNHISGSNNRAYIITSKDNTANTTRTTFSNCDAETGGAIYSDSSVNYSGDVFKVLYSDFSNCDASSNSGAIQFSNTVTSVTMQHNKFSSCSAGNNYGAIGFSANITTQLDFKYNNFSSCSSGSAYGAIGFSSTVNALSAYYNVFNGCTSTLAGGAIGFTSGSNMTGTNTFAYSAFIKCTAKTNGGAIAFHGSASNSVVLRNNLFLGCKANDSGGALYIAPADGKSINSFTLYYGNRLKKYLVNDQDYNFDITYTSSSGASMSESTVPAVFYECEADVLTSDDKRGRGGAIDLRGTITTFTINTFENDSDISTGFDKILMQNCKAHRGYGGGIYLGSTSTNININGSKSGANANNNSSNENLNFKIYEDGRDTDLTASFKNCYAIWGGAICELGNISTMTFNGVLVDNCSAMEGSALLLRNSDATMATTNFNIKNSIFRNCSTYDGEDHDNDVLGGTIRTFGNANKALTMTNCSVIKNMSHYAGAGIYWNACGSSLKSKLTIKGSMIQNNHARLYGGGVYSSADISINDTIINHNTAGNTGGGICHGVYGNDIVPWSNDTVELTLGNNMKVNENVAGRYGGGIAILTRYSINKFATDLENPRDMTIKFTMQDNVDTPAQIVNNVAGRYGGGVYYGIGNDVNDKEYSTTPQAPTGSYLFENSSNWNVTAANKQWLVDLYKKQININSGVISGNVAGIDGGGIYAKGKNTTINVKNGSITNNYAGVKDVTKTYYTISENSKEYQSKTLTLSKTEYAGHGGGICFKGVGSVCNVTGGKIGTAPSNPSSTSESVLHTNGNKADLGGGIAAMKGKIVLSQGSTIQYNYAHAGGGMYTYNGGAVVMNGGNVNYNHADSSDTLGIGTCDSKQATTAVTNSSVTVNDVEDYAFVSGSGGAIYANSSSSISGTSDSAKLTGGNVESNSASGGAGGGIFANNGGDVTVDGGIVRYNSAKGSSNATTAYHSTNLVGVGGAIALGDGLSGNASTFTLTDSTRTNEGKYKSGIYSNIADFAAADVYASGNNTKLNVLQALDMNLLDYAGKANGWYEDYHGGDTKYIPDSSGNNRDNVGRYESINEIVRYSTAKNRIVNDVDKAPTVNGIEKQSVNQKNTYVCMILGISEAGIFSVTKHVLDVNGANIDLDTDELFKFTITSTDSALGSDVKYQPFLNKLYDDTLGEIPTTEANPSSSSDGKTLTLYLQAGQIAQIKGTGAYTVTEELSSKQKTYVVSTSLKKNNAVVSKVQTTGGGYIENVMAEGDEAEFTNKVKCIDVVIKYYDRKIVDGQPTDINKEASSYTKRYIGEDLYSGEVVDLSKLIAKTGVWATKDHITNNVVDDYLLFTTQRNAVSTVNGKFYPGTEVTYGDKFSGYTKFHNNAHGNPTNITDYWVNYYEDSERLDDSSNIEIGTDNNIDDCLNVSKIETWLFNQPKQYTVTPHIISDTSATNMKECKYSTSGIPSTETAAYDRYVATTTASTQKVYYNQRLGTGSGNSGTNANTPHLTPYTIKGYTDNVVTSTREVRYANTNLVFAYWSFDEEGKTIASTDYEYNYRITKDTSLYAVYLTPKAYKNTRYTKGVSVYANKLDEFYGGNGEAKTRLNTVLNPYNFNENDSSIKYFGAVYVVPEKDTEITPSIVNDLRSQIKSKLLKINTESKGSFKVTIADEDKNSNYYVYVRGEESLTDKNRAHFSIAFANTSLINKRILAFGALKTDSWMISDNCIDYQFDSDGLLENGTASIHKYQ